MNVQSGPTIRRSAVDPAVGRIATDIRRSPPTASTVVRERVHVARIACQVDAGAAGGTLGIAGDLGQVARRDADRDRVPANYSSAQRGLLIRIFLEETIRRAKKRTLRVCNSVGLNDVILKIDKND